MVKLICLELIMHLDHAHIFFFNNIEKHTNALDKIWKWVNCQGSFAIWKQNCVNHKAHAHSHEQKLLSCTHQVHPTCSHDCAKARWPPQHAYITAHHTTTHTTTTPHIQNSNQNGAMHVAKVMWHNDLSAGSQNNTEAIQAALWLVWAMP